MCRNRRSVSGRERRSRTPSAARGRVTPPRAGRTLPSSARATPPSRRPATNPSSSWRPNSPALLVFPTALCVGGFEKAVRAIASQLAIRRRSTTSRQCSAGGPSARRPPITAPCRPPSARRSTWPRCAANRRSNSAARTACAGANSSSGRFSQTPSPAWPARSGRGSRPSPPRAARRRRAYTPRRWTRRTRRSMPR